MGQALGAFCGGNRRRAATSQPATANGPAPLVAPPTEQPNVPAPQASALNDSPSREQLLEQRLDHLNRTGTTTTFPSIAQDTWSKEKPWREFRKQFLVNRRPVLLRPDETICVVCREPYYQGKQNMPIRLPCDSQHPVCLLCAVNWFGPGNDLTPAKNTCPTCRKELFKNDGAMTGEEYRAFQAQFAYNLQVMRQTSREIEETVQEVWDTVLMRYSHNPDFEDKIKVNFSLRHHID